MEDVNYKPLVAFPDAGQSFTNGFEAGMLWERLYDKDVQEHSGTFHLENMEVFERMAKVTGHDILIEDILDYDEYRFVTFTKNTSEERTTKKPALRLVDNDAPDHGT